MHFRLPFRIPATRIFRSRRVSIIAAIVIAFAITSLVISYDRRNTANFQAGLRQVTEQGADLIEERVSRNMARDVAILQFLADAISGSDNATTTRLMANHHLLTSSHFIGLGITEGGELRTLYSAAWRNRISREDLRDIITKSLKHPEGGMAAPFLKPYLLPVQGDVLVLSVPVIRGHGVELEEQGTVIAIMDLKGFMASAKVAPEDLYGAVYGGTLFAIRESGTGALLSGDAAINSDDDVERHPQIPGTQWMVQASPAGGWDRAPDNRMWFRLMLGVVTLAMIVPIFIAVLLIAERNRHIDELRARERRFFELSQRFRLAVESAGIGIWSLDTQTQRGLWDARAAQLHGMEEGDGVVRVEDLLQAVVPADQDALETYIFNCMFGMHPVSTVYRVRVGAELRHLQLSGANHTDEKGNTRITGIIRDVSTDMQMAQHLRESKENSELKNAELELALQELSSREGELEDLSLKLDVALASYNCGIWETDVATDTQIWDRRMCQLYGIDLQGGTLSTEQWLALVHEEDRPVARRHINKETAGTVASDALVVRVPQPDGSIRYIRSLGQFHNSDGGARRIVGIAVDVTEDAILTERLTAAKNEADARNNELEAARQRIEHNALHDPLTGLPNRRKLDLALEELGSGHDGERARFAILHLDLDRFKQINDTLGHAAGDAMLIHAASLLAENVDSNDLVARIGGDEFVIVVRDYATATEIRHLANSIITAFRDPVMIEGVSSRCGVSIGIALCDGIRRSDPRTILVNADIALYRAKATGRNCHQFFTQNLQAEIINTKRIADEILTGLENGEFVTWYQPQLCATTRQLSGVEALIRWNHPTRGILTPDKFLKVAEDLNVVATLDRLVLETALRDRRLWQMQGIDIRRVSVNVSSRRLHDESLIESLESLAIIPGEVAFELVESIFLDESDEVASTNLDRLKALGVDIEIDDFGTGHTSIISLLKLKPHRLKIDRQLVMPIATSPQEKALVASIIEIARTLGVETIAEGVETLEHASILQAMGCDHLQGYAFARALPAKDFASFAREDYWRKVS